MDKIKTVATAAHLTVLSFFTPPAEKKASERGSLTLEQIIWTVAIAVVAIAIVAIVVTAINGRAAELPL